MTRWTPPRVITLLAVVFLFFKAFGFADAPMPPAMDNGPLITGIPALGPGAKRVITWGQYGGLFKALGQETIQVTVDFKSKHAWSRSDHSNICPIDVHSFAETDVSDSNWDKKIAESLQKIAQCLEKRS